MKKIIAVLIIFIVSTEANAQVKLDDFGRITLNSFLSENLEIPLEAKNLLLTKLNQITSNNGMSGSQANPRFIITANINIGTKDIIAGPPQMLAQNFDITFFIGDALANTAFSNITISLKGVGVNENKLFIDALKLINPKNKEIVNFLEEGKGKIINYYNTRCDFIIKEVQTLVKQEKYDEAIYQLTLVPDVCQACYFKCLDTLTHIYQQKIDADCKVKFNKAKAEWISSQNSVGAEKVSDILNSINPQSSCQSEVNVFLKSIDSKLKEDERVRWQFKMKQYNDRIQEKKEQLRIAEEKGKRDDSFRENQALRDATLREKQSLRNYELDKVRVTAFRDVAVEYAKNQPKTVTYNRIYWR